MFQQQINDQTGADDLNKVADPNVDPANLNTDPNAPDNGDAGSDDVDIRELINSQTGFNIELEFDGTVDSVVNYVKEANKLSVDQVYNDIQQNFPMIYEMLEIAYNGGNLNEVVSRYAQFAVNDIYATEIAPDNVTMQKEMFFRFNKEQNPLMNDRIIAEIADKMVNDGTLLDEVTKIQNFVLQDRHQNQQRILAEERQYQMQIAEQVKHAQQNILDVVQKGQLGRFGIPKQDTNGFLQHLDGVIGWTNEGRPYVAQYLDEGDALADEYYRFKKGDLSKIVEQQVKHQMVVNLKNKASNFKNDAKQNSAKTDNPFQQ
jgi:hypothetical protein